MDTTHHRFRKSLVNQINSLSTTEHREIYKILSNHGINCTHNKNGAFVNFSNLSSEIVEEIKKFTDFCLSNKKELDEYDRKMSECKIFNNYRNIIEDAKDTGDDAYAENIPNDDWNAVIKTVTNTEVQKEHVSRYIDFLSKNQQLDVRLVRKTASHNKFATAKKKYCKKSIKCAENDMPDCLDKE